jgi:O-antigen/teichoic acid export membrane protein
MAKEGSLTEKTGVVVFARITNTVVQLAIVITAIQILSKSDFAIIGYLLMIHQIVRRIACLGFPESIFFFFERVAKGARKAFALQTSSVLVVMALLAGGVILGVRALTPHLLTNWAASDVGSVQYLLLFMGLVIILEIPVWPVTNILLATERQKQAAWYDIFCIFLNFFCFAVPLWFGYSLTVAVYGLVLYAVIRFVVSIIWVMMILPGSIQQRSGISIRRQIQFSSPLGISSMMNRMNFFVDKFVVSLLLSAAAYANYTIGAQEMPIIRAIPFAVGSVLISRYVRLEIQSKKDELLQLWHKGIEKTSLMVLPLGILSIVIAPDLIKLIASSKHTSYAAAVIPFQIYNIIVLLRVTNYNSILQAFDDTKGVLYMSINLLLANIVLSIPFTIMFGITGTAISALLANAYNWVLVMRRIARHMEISFFEVLPLQFYGKVLTICTGAGIVVWFLRVYYLSSVSVWTSLVFSISAFFLLFGAAGTFIGVITQKDWQDFGNWLRLRFLMS